MELEKLRQVIAEVLSVDPREVTEETTFVEDLCADSLDVYQIIMGIEDAFEIRIPACILLVLHKKALAFSRGIIYNISNLKSLE